MNGDASVREVLTLEDVRWTALVAGDVGQLGSVYHDEMFYTHSNGMPDAAATYLNALRKGVFRYTSADRSQTQARAFGLDTVVVTGQAELGTEFEGRAVTVKMRYTAVWCKEAVGWKFVCWHATGIR